ncbi:MAG TPA: hypothetical protein VGI39_45635, partial [Polyangiaceae bacterium]
MSGKRAKTRGKRLSSAATLEVVAVKEDEAQLLTDKDADADVDLTAIDELLELTAHKSETRRHSTMAAGADSLEDSLEARYRNEKRWSDLVEVYLQRIAVTRAPAERAELLRRIGTVMLEELDDAPQALDAFLEALLLEPHHDATVIAVEALADGLSRWEGVVEEVERSLGHDDEDRTLTLYEHLSRWTARHLGKRDEAAKFLARIKAADPGRSVVHARQASVHREQGAFEAQQVELERALLS